MYSLTIHFGPNAMVWALLYKEKAKAEASYRSISASINEGLFAQVTDDFGQTTMVGQIHGILLEDLDLVEEARILRSLANARGEVKARQRASTDPVIRQTQREGPAVLTPMGGGFRSN